VAKTKVHTIGITFLICFSVSQKLVKQDGEFVVVKIDDHFQEVTSPNSYEVFGVGSQKESASIIDLYILS